MAKIEATIYNENGARYKTKTLFVFDSSEYAKKRILIGKKAIIITNYRILISKGKKFLQLSELNQEIEEILYNQTSR